MSQRAGPPKKGSNNVIPAKAGIFWLIIGTHFVLEDPRLCGDDENFPTSCNLKANQASRIVDQTLALDPTIADR